MVQKDSGAGVEINLFLVNKQRKGTRQKVAPAQALRPKSTEGAGR